MSILAVTGALILLTGLATLRIHKGERLYYLSLLQLLVLLPILAAQYVLFTQPGTEETVRTIFFSEMALSWIWFCAAYWLNRATERDAPPSKGFLVVHVGAIGVILALGLGNWIGENGYEVLGQEVLFRNDAIFHVITMSLLFSMAAMSWRLENFWRRLSPQQRWEYKYLVAGKYLVCATLGWAVSFRIIYHRMGFDHFQLMSSLLLFSWTMMIYAVARHRLINRKFYVSRKVVYAFVAPMTFGAYLIFIGIVVLLMRALDITFPSVVRWFLLVAGAVGLILMALSGKMRHSVKYFVSTHFYNNKYEYRDEWLDFSHLLQDAMTQAEVVAALEQVLSRSLYTNVMVIWVEDVETGAYRPTRHRGVRMEEEEKYVLPPGHPLPALLREKGIHDARAKSDGAVGAPPFFPDMNLALFVALTIGDQVVGMIGLGPEFTGGRYGEDDFDLLTALGTQAAGALMAIRMGEKVARMRQQEAWDVMSAFILHDVKNAASMLSLLRRNAPDHLHDPEFQQDMLETIDDALKRMGKVQHRLSALQREIVPQWRVFLLGDYLETTCRRIERRLAGLEVVLSPSPEMEVSSDPELLTRVVENLLLNAFEAGGKGTRVTVEWTPSNNTAIHVAFSDNGPGLPEQLAPEAIFEPFRTTKPTGSGIGLWQAKRLMAVLGGNIHAERIPDGGARFVLTLPVAA